mgnify:CR=1 FL=1|tara:strand:- start:4611 stop:4856 length:246 start_codon:yes stop_codon:yes gene_type:complete
MKIKQEFGNIIYNDGTIAMKVKYIFKDVVSMMLFFKDEIWTNRPANDGNSWEVNRSELTIICTTFVKALDHYNALIEGEEE